MCGVNDVICEGMPGASFTISFNCLADLVSMALEGGFTGQLYPQKNFSKNCFNLVHFMDFVSNLDSHTGLIYWAFVTQLDPFLAPD